MCCVLCVCAYTYLTKCTCIYLKDSHHNIKHTMKYFKVVEEYLENLRGYTEVSRSIAWCWWETSNVKQY